MMARIFWLLVALLGAFCIMRLASSSGDARYLVGLPAFIFTIARACD